MAETMDLYNRLRHPLDRTAPLGAKTAAGEYHIDVFGWIESTKGAFLMVRRKDEATGSQMWDAVSATVPSGENSLAAVLRAVKEELGIEPDVKKIKLHSSLRVDKTASFHDVFLLRADTKLEDLTVNADTLAEARWMMPAEIEALGAEGRMVPSAEEYGDIIFPE